MAATRGPGMMSAGTRSCALPRNLSARDAVLPNATTRKDFGDRGHRAQVQSAAASGTLAMGGLSVAFRFGVLARIGGGDERVVSCECGGNSHLRFQLSLRRFGGFEGTAFAETGWECSELDCKSLSNSVQSGSHKGDAPSESMQELPPNFGFYLHDIMDQAGLETTHARIARAGYAKEVAKLVGRSGEPENKELEMEDLARAMLEIAAEDDALVSHSSVPLPVDMYLERLDGMAAEFAGHHLPVEDRGPSAIFEALDNYLFVYKGFRRTNSKTSRDPRDFYLNGVLTRRLGTPVMLGLIYSEVVKRLWLQGAIDFLVQMQLPKIGDEFFQPKAVIQGRGLRDNAIRRPQAESGERLHENLLTSELVLLEILRSLKTLYWPWKADNGVSEGSDFLDAAAASSRGTVSSSSKVHGPFESLFTAPSSSRGSEVARARAASLRLQRGIWTSTTFGDLRRALAVPTLRWSSKGIILSLSELNVEASERLVILGTDKRENRDYGMLLFHCGLYEEAFHYLDSFSKASAPAVVSHVEARETIALDRLLERLRLILIERSWNIPPDPPQAISSPPDPW